MPVIRFPTPRYRQPALRTDINWHNPLSQNLLRLWNFAQPLSVAELVRGPADVTVTGTLEHQGTGFALGLYKPSSAYAVTNDNYRLDIADKVTWFLEFELASATNNSFIFGNVQPNGTGYNAGLYVSGAGKPIFFLRNSGGTSVNALGTTTLAADTRYQMVGTYDGAALKIWLNGVNETSAVPSPAQTGSVQQTDYDTTLNRWNNGSSLLVRYVIGGVANRTWSPGDVAAFKQNPYQMLRQYEMNMYFPVAAAPGGSAFPWHYYAQLNRQTR
jgi:hypothetical protein